MSTVFFQFGLSNTALMTLADEVLAVRDVVGFSSDSPDGRSSGSTKLTAGSVPAAASL